MAQASSRADRSGGREASSTCKCFALRFKGEGAGLPVEGGSRYASGASIQFFFGQDLKY